MEDSIDVGVASTALTSRPKSEDPFCPKAILQPGKERKQDWTKFLDRLTENKVAIGETIVGLSERIAKNPDLPLFELEDLVDRSQFSANLTKDQKTIIKKGLEIYGLKHQLISQARTSYPDDRELYAYIIGRKPEGRIEVIARPMLLYIRCFSKEDYVTAYWGVVDSTKLEREKVDAASRSGGAALFQVAKADLGGNIALENTSSINSINEEAIGDQQNMFLPGERRLFGKFLQKMFKVTRSLKRKFVKDLGGSVVLEQPIEEKDLGYDKTLFAHEQQHILWNLFRNTMSLSATNNVSLETRRALYLENGRQIFTDPYISFSPYLRVMKALIPDITSEEQEQYFYRVLRRARTRSGLRFQDEMLAYFMDGRSTAETVALLCKPKSQGGLYDFFDDDFRRGVVTEWTNVLGANYQAAIKRQVDKVFVQDHNAVLEKAARALTMLKNCGFPRSEIVALLMLEPMEKWDKVVTRILLAKGVKKEELESYQLPDHWVPMTVLFAQDTEDHITLNGLRRKPDLAGDDKFTIKTLERIEGLRKEEVISRYRSGRLRNEADYYQAAQILRKLTGTLEDKLLARELLTKAWEKTSDQSMKDFYSKLMMYDQWKYFSESGEGGSINNF